MRDSKFKELVNLYLDSEIEAEDLRSLERELKISSSRRNTFANYCRLHRASCEVLSSNLAHTASRTTALDSGKFSYAAPIGLAVACVTLAFTLVTLSLVKDDGIVEFAQRPLELQPTGGLRLRDSGAERDIKSQALLVKRVPEFSRLLIEPEIEDSPFSVEEALFTRLNSTFTVEPDIPDNFKRDSLPVFETGFPSLRPNFLENSSRRLYRSERVGFIFQR